MQGERCLGPSWHDLDLLDLDGTAEQTSPASGNETDFLSRNSRAGDCGSLSDMLMVTTTVRMVHGVHSHTTSTGPVVTLSLVFVVRTASLEQGLVDTTTTGDDSDCRARASCNSFFLRHWEDGYGSCSPRAGDR